MTGAELTEQARAALQRLIRDVPDFPEPGVVFKDITPLLADVEAMQTVVAALAASGRGADGGVAVDMVVGMEARGFIFGPLVAAELGVGFVPVRKEGKLPRETTAVSYSLEYGEETLEVHRDALAAGSRVLVVDDVLATGGTLEATRELIEGCGASVAAIAMLMELTFLSPRDRLGGLPIDALWQIEE